MRVHFLSFFDGLSDNKYKDAAIALKKMAIDMNIFSSIKFYTIKELEEDSDFSENVAFCKANLRGCGYWIWKPFIIWKRLKELDDGDILFYCDSCTSLNTKYRQRFIEYIEMAILNPQGNLFFEYVHRIGDWCKFDVIHELEAQGLIYEKEVVPGVLFTSATANNKELFKLCYETCCNKHMITDTPSIRLNLPQFKEHRHDQTIFSIRVRQMSQDSIHANLFHEIYQDTNNYPISIQTNHYRNYTNKPL
jgi:hypothetical protein